MSDQPLQGKFQEDRFKSSNIKSVIVHPLAPERQTESEKVQVQLWCFMSDRQDERVVSLRTPQSGGFSARMLQCVNWVQLIEKNINKTCRNVILCVGVRERERDCV